VNFIKRNYPPSPNFIDNGLYIGLVVEHGDKYWYLNGKQHRVDGPAVEWADGSIFWYLNGLRHREDGPALEWPNKDNECFLHNDVILHPECFESMKTWLQYLNDNEEQTYQLIHDYNGFIEFINNPSAKQIRVHQMAHIL